MAKYAGRTVIVNDATKLGHAGPVRYMKIEEIDELITDRSADRATVAKLRRQGIKVTLT